MYVFCVYIWVCVLCMYTMYTIYMYAIYLYLSVGFSIHPCVICLSMHQSMYVYYLCILCIYTLFIYRISILLCIDILYRSIFLSIGLCLLVCILCVYTIYVYCLCIVYMYTVYVYYVCTRCICISVYSTCLLFVPLSIHPSICLAFCQFVCTI